MSDSLNIIECTKLVKEYDRSIRALDGLTLSVPAGSIFGFIGLNGAGKTTTIRILAGQVKQDEGDLRLFGKPITGLGSAMKRDIGFVLDEPLYFEWMKAHEYLSFVGAMYGLPEAETSRRAAELLEFFDLTVKTDANIGSYSTGMKKKISLAAAIIHRPKLIVLDEPLEGIDAVAASAIKETLTLMAANGTTILISSHVLDTVEKFCTDVGIVHKGKVLLQCKTADIRSRAKNILTDKPFGSLEELFVDLVTEKQHTKKLSFLS
jgi:ABC-2 type transport system ATP-binding protein